MKLTTTFSILVTICLLALVPVSEANGTQDLAVELMFNHNDPGDVLDTRYDDTFGGGVAMTYMFNKYVGARASTNYLKYTRDFDGGDLGIIRLNLNARVNWPIIHRLSVYGIAGMGLYSWDADYIWWSDTGAENGLDLGYNWGIGASYEVWDGIEATLLYDRHSVEFEDSDDRSCWAEISLGVTFHLDPTVFAH